MPNDSHVRSVVKSMTWRACATITTILLVFMFTQRIEIAVSVGAIEVVTKLLIYYAHERAWNLVSWGKPVPRASTEVGR